jgi:phosphatidylserine decarboxylase
MLYHITSLIMLAQAWHFHSRSKLTYSVTIASFHCYMASFNLNIVEFQMFLERFL